MICGRGWIFGQNQFRLGLRRVEVDAMAGFFSNKIFFFLSRWHFLGVSGWSLLLRYIVWLGRLFRCSSFSTCCYGTRNFVCGWLFRFFFLTAYTCVGLVSLDGILGVKAGSGAACGSSARITFSFSSSITSFTASSSSASGASATGSAEMGTAVFCQMVFLAYLIGRFMRLRMHFLFRDHGYITDNFAVVIGITFALLLSRGCFQCFPGWHEFSLAFVRCWMGGSIYSIFRCKVLLVVLLLF